MHNIDYAQALMRRIMIRNSCNHEEDRILSDKPLTSLPLIYRNVFLPFQEKTTILKLEGWWSFFLPAVEGGWSRHNK
jgi:hypothetical protein